MPDGTHAGEVVEQRFFDRLPPHIAASLTAEQRSAIAAAAGEPEWTGGHPINIRLSLPALFGRAYVTIVAGRERRDGRRRHHDRARNPLNTMGNFVFVIGAAIVFYVAAVAIASWL